MDSLRNMIADYSDEELLKMHRQRDDYTAEAFKVIDGEIARRGLDAFGAAKAAERTEAAVAASNAAVANLNRDDFEPLPHPFAKADTLTANSILHNSKVPYVIDKHDGEEFTDLFCVRVYKDAMEKAVELIEEHFEAGQDGRYVLRQSDIIARLKAFGFNDFNFSPRAAQERLDVEFSAAEKAEIVKLAELLVKEADKIEEEMGRVVFFYDTIEALAGKLKGKNKEGITRIDFLAIIELCQIYCEDRRYNRQILDHIVASIIDFFM